ncbi:UDP-2-acetamido-2,6-beta-L-arabino-hexul-4-ose reductase [Pseudomonas marginalis]|uniref:UDP-2-acetamido-2,6-beta-L-arabino-hexul-4-ose reductase n=1 Tax=Pseudomonas marginalis TaxID=298 RepID=UPI002034097E|nr:NAD-dependent epimerase/dehydratase family protein [Pseudomonas marginalis]MCM2379522.1 NAD-dependent epimerase/dehydratase family protein [Pseudomonas marginalis]
MKVLITGADGFLGRNLISRLNELAGIEIIKFRKGDDFSDLVSHAPQLDFIFHLAGVNRPQNVSEFTVGNIELTSSLCELVVNSGRSVPILFTSSTQAGMDNAYGISKLEAEKTLETYSRLTGAPVLMYRLPNVFGKWSRPNYNSVVATFCYNVARDLPITVNNALSIIDLVYIDDVIDNFIFNMTTNVSGFNRLSVTPAYQVTVGGLAEQIKEYRLSRETLVTERVGTGLARALYSTYLSFIPKGDFAYPVKKYEDPRGVFVEMLKTKDSGQFSYFTAYPGITRGGHYHHTKTEKFLVVKGNACFRFRNIVTNEYCEIFTEGAIPQIVETVPGWTHDITNVGVDEMVVMLWANEIFDRGRPDTFQSEIVH